MNIEYVPWFLVIARFSTAVFLSFFLLVSKCKNYFIFLLLFIPAFTTDFLDGFVMRHYAPQYCFESFLLQESFTCLKISA
ncbi:MAG: hypothetical protein A3G33_06065 [Omnitrophica bacterium RIFCSPLOWO2_12_FULL_44_17]|uniref:CDP-diacylglycerol--glycerol-3-phosphate 3-phosphatidyltransferase n=1 Tax=Candidatus Danuiimicrobium aquiferis TaxID=1801832 RepID=A0A1G1KS16_9BACT|nr:MAG: hypothetical protein A3B72_02555 [Omnitrophica bacterium RIFCSPHIGHO2_02_FULL_45_28]OGW91579.1 MAG: hypothetical protein A3E74_07025 [Omnitrophica bacterium RIFCSPHIGHO2_12_FULL_44_12]OGW95349.1 MAG: hypothetical protein A3G33_06065 [Omnitrophica bacterium RIFCSPLOWO2_12_FULL_44_17]OGX04054.1 MAG: hypothetical protein A3J12_08635 [Omnitrophica bacterium RIFCSPLOWO2_02_FULL_44_11]